MGKGPVKTGPLFFCVRQELSDGRKVKVDNNGKSAEKN
jgi:hypothetical protein